jgi:fructuronate reductase
MYTVNEREGERQNPRVIGSILDGSLYSLDSAALAQAILSPELKLITITVTEKAYQAGIQSDSMPNRLLDILQLRFSRGLAAPVLISCDNLPANGQFLRRVLLASAHQRDLDSDFQQWLANISAPNSMVDRIVPAITPSAIEEFEREFGIRDESLISTEPFRQWVVEPHADDRLLADIGIEISPEVEEYEALKLRLFNGAHSTTAYFSQLSGIEYVYQAIALPKWSGFITRLQEQLANSFVAPSSVDVAKYCAQARARIGNSAVAHRSAQIAMDGSAKLPQRLFHAMNALHQARQPRERIAFAISLWIRFLQSGLSVTDPLAEGLLDRARVEESNRAVRQVMQTPGLQAPINEEDWPVIAGYLDQVRKFGPLAVAENL